MTYYSAPGVTLYHGDVREKLREMDVGSAAMCVTSPPYWGLRDYGTATWDGGDAECDHRGRANPKRDSTNQSAGNWMETRATQPAKDYVIPYRSLCGKCGAVRQDRQLGLEETPAEYIANMAEVFREVRRVLRDDGTLWLNIGDSYTSGGRQTRDPGQSKIHTPFVDWQGGRPGTPAGLKPKDLVGIPWMLAFALRDDGWYLRSDIIWHKPNPMPESVTDRPTKAHEYLFLLTKRASYYYDADAVREAASEDSGWAKQRAKGVDTWQYNDTPERIAVTGQRTEASTFGTAGARNKRSVWTIATEAYPEAHFATFPTALVRPCILAGSAEGGTVLDPFTGSGTTGAVARALNREFVGIDLSEEYLRLAIKRIGTQMPMELAL